MTNLTRSFMKKPLTCLLLLLSMAIAMPALAELELTGTYYGIQFYNSDFEFDYDAAAPNLDTEESWNFLEVKYGKQTSEMMAFEGRFGLSNNLGKDYGVLTYGAYLRIGKDFGQYRPYGLIGGTGIMVDEEVLNDLYDVDEFGFSYGVGIEIFGSPNVAITFEYLNAIDDSVDDGDLTFNSIGLGFNYYFSEETSTFNKNRNKIRSIRY